MELKQKIIIGLLIIGIILIAVYSPDFNRSYEETIINVHFNGIISKKNIDKQNHSQPKITFTTGDYVYLNDLIYRKISIGDSIYKSQGGKYVYILKSNSLDSLKYD